MDVPGFALITGAASGIGKACASGFLTEGAAGIALLDIDSDLLLEVKAELESQQRKIKPDPETKTKQACQVLTFALDVTDEDQVNAAVHNAAAQFGRLDYVVNAAGIAMKHEGGAAYARTSDWRRVVDVNLTGSFFVLRAAAKVMLRQSRMVSSIDGRAVQRGSIVNFSSIQGLVGISLSTAYAATKHGVLGLTRSASEDYAAHGVRVNAICPGYTETPLTMGNPAVLQAMRERVDTAVPMRRMGQAREIADGVLYLAGGRSSFVTGTALAVDGGYTSR